MNKNDLLTVTIEDLTKDGEGIGHADGFTLFVKDALIGDKVLARITRPKKTYAFARVEKILEPGACRTAAPCPEARRCGGCRLQEMDYAAQLAWKRKLVKDTMTRIGGLPELEVRPVIGMDVPYRYRNKAQYPVGMVEKNTRLAAGFYAGRTHTLIPVTDCLLTPVENAHILETVLAFAEKWRIPAYDEKTGQGLLRHILVRKGFATGQILVCFIINGRELPHSEELVDELRRIPGVTSICLNINTKRTNVILGSRVIPLWGDPWIEDVLGGLRFRISPLSFYQVNPVQCEKLYGEALKAAALTGKETVYDLYCGIGTISLFLARHAKAVYGVEIIPDAIRDAKENAERNGIENAHFYTGAAEDLVVRGRFDEKTPCPPADVVVLDPPRKGCAPELIDAVLRMAPERVIYVSCDPATLARDLKRFHDGNGTVSYAPAYVQPTDMFPETTHCENVCLLERRG
ncbi:MAG: 23S rRNA (uracil(1939)-C(5))-methyltransferase RlmD [Chordicoccus sp.]